MCIVIYTIYIRHVYTICHLYIFIIYVHSISRGKLAFSGRSDSSKLSLRAFRAQDRCRGCLLREQPRVVMLYCHLLSWDTSPARRRSPRRYKSHAHLGRDDVSRTETGPKWIQMDLNRSFRARNIASERHVRPTEPQGHFSGLSQFTQLAIRCTTVTFRVVRKAPLGSMMGYPRRKASEGSRL